MPGPFAPSGRNGDPQLYSSETNATSEWCSSHTRPLGGGEGKSSGGRPPTNPWGKVEGKKTRHKKKASTKLIVRGRKRGRATT